MATKNHQSYDTLLFNAGVLIANAQSDEGIRNALSVYGYSDAKLAAGKALLDEVSALFAKQRQEYGEQLAATEAVEDAWIAADKVYIATLRIARIACNDDTNGRVSLALDGSRKKSLSGWIEQATKFYANILSSQNIQTLLSQYGYDKAKLESEQLLVKAVSDASNKQAKETGEAQSATVARDKKFDELMLWVGSLRKVARIALQDNPQWLEKLGITAYSEGYLKAKAAAAKPTPPPAEGK